jgi:hypothetical protein
VPKELKNRKKMINIKKLHLVHKYYPNVPRRFGKTTYCYDSLLRASETEYYETICYLTNTASYARESFKDFTVFLNAVGESYQILDLRTLVLGDSKITFLGKAENKFVSFDGYIEDYF